MSDTDTQPAYDPRDQRIDAALKETPEITAYSVLQLDGRENLTLRTAEDVYRENKRYYETNTFDGVSIRSGQELRDYAAAHPRTNDLNDPAFHENDAFWSTLKDQVHEHFMTMKSWVHVVSPENIGVPGSQLKDNALEVRSRSGRDIAQSLYESENFTKIVRGIYGGQSKTPEIGDSPKSVTSLNDRRDILLNDENLSPAEQQVRLRETQSTVIDMANFFGMTGTDMLIAALEKNPELLNMPFREAWAQLNPSMNGSDGRIANAYLKSNVVLERIVEDFENKNTDDTLGTFLRHVVARDIPLPPPVVAAPPVVILPEPEPAPVPEIIPEAPPPVEKIETAPAREFTAGIYYTNTTEALQILPGADPSNVQRTEYGLMGELPFENDSVIGSVNMRVGQASGSSSPSQNWSTSLGSMNVDLPDGYGVYVDANGDPVKTAEGLMLTGREDNAALGALDRSMNSVSLSPGDISISRDIQSYSNYMTYGLGGDIYLKDKDIGFNADFSTMSGEDASRKTLDLGVVKGFESSSSLHVGVNAERSELRMRTGHEVTETPSGFHRLDTGNFGLNADRTLSIAPAVIGERDLSYVDLNVNPRTHVEETPRMENYREPINEHYREPINEHYRDPVMENYREPINEHYRDPVMENYRDPINEHYRDPINEHYREKRMEPYKDPVMEKYCDPIKETVQIPDMEKVCIKGKWITRQKTDEEGNPLFKTVTRHARDENGRLMYDRGERQVVIDGVPQWDEGERQVVIDGVPQWDEGERQVVIDGVPQWDEGTRQVVIDGVPQWDEGERQVVIDGVPQWDEGERQVVIDGVPQWDEGERQVVIDGVPQWDEGERQVVIDGVPQVDRVVVNDVDAQGRQIYDGGDSSTTTIKTQELAYALQTNALALQNLNFQSNDKIKTERFGISSTFTTQNGLMVGGFANYAKTDIGRISFSGQSSYTSKDESYHKAFDTIGPNADDQFVRNDAGEIVGLTQGDDNRAITPGAETYTATSSTRSVDFTNTLDAQNKQIEIGAHVTKFVNPDLLVSGYATAKFNEYNATLDRSFDGVNSREHFSDRYNQYTVGGNVAYRMTDRLTGSVGAGYNFGDRIDNSFNAQATLTYRFGGESSSRSRSKIELPSHYRGAAVESSGRESADQARVSAETPQVFKVDQADTNQKVPEVVKVIDTNIFDTTGRAANEVPVEDLDALNPQNKIALAGNF